MAPVPEREAFDGAAGEARRQSGPANCAQRAWRFPLPELTPFIVQIINRSVLVCDEDAVALKLFEQAGQLQRGDADFPGEDFHRSAERLAAQHEDDLALELGLLKPSRSCVLPRLEDAGDQHHQHEHRERRVDDVRVRSSSSKYAGREALTGLT